MDFVRRIALLRLTALIAIGVSAVLTVDHLRPGRAFCPLAEACAAARDSALGSIGGVPTSVIGMVAFGALIVLTLLPLEISRPVLKPVGGIAAAAGLGLIAYQRVELGTYCPLCLVADGAGFVAGMLTVFWPQLPLRPSGRFIRWESGGARSAWTMAAILAAVVPFAIPRPVDTGWVEITPLAAGAFSEQDAIEVVAEPIPPRGATAVPAVPPASVRVDAPVPPAPSLPLSRPAADTPRAVLAVAPPASRPPVVVPPPVVLAPARVAPAPPAASPARAGREPGRAPRFAPRFVPGATPAPVAKQGPGVVLYLNAFCGHCRATHKRLDAVIAETGVALRRRRIYTWAGKKIPAWARACAFAQTQGLEERMFTELMKARRESTSEVLEAARRAGVDVDRLRACLKQRAVPPRLQRDRRLVQRARIRKLPTIDIGRRRLMGAQSKAELRAAITAAMDANSG